MRVVWLLLAPVLLFGQSPAKRPAFDAFEVATIKPTAPDSRARYIRMQSVNRFYATGFTFQALVAAAYSLTPRAISGGPAWTDSDRYDILASTPGGVQPSSTTRWRCCGSSSPTDFNSPFIASQKSS